MTENKHISKRNKAPKGEVKNKNAKGHVKKLQTRLHDLENKYNALMSATPDMMFLLDAKGNYLDYFPSKDATAALPSEYFIGNNVADIMPSELANRYIALIKTVLDSDRVEYVQYALTDPNGERFFEARLVKCTNKSVLIIVRDITDVNEAEAKLRLKEEHYKHLIDEIPCGVFTGDTESNILDANPYGCKMLGYELSELKSISARKLFPLSNKAFDEIMKKGKLINHEAVLRHKNGAEIYVSINAILEKENDSLNISAIVNDETEKRILEKEKARVRQQMDKSLKIREDFLAKVSHEIRTPLNAIVGANELLSGTKMSSKQKEYTSIMSIATNDLLSLIDELLHFSQIHIGKVKLQNAPFRITNLIESIETAEAPEAKKKGLEIEFECDNNIPEWIYGDRTKLKIILNNLIGNAIKFTTKGSVKVAVWLSENQGDKVELLFSVKDTGRGIPKLKQKDIFKSFVQLEDNTISREKGIGLGLSIVKKLVNTMNGEVEINSKVGVGTEFSVLLKFDLPEDYHKVEKPTKLSSPYNFEKLKFLIVEDNELNLKITEDILKDVGAEVILATSGKKALKELEKNRFDFILLDLELPDIHGFDILRYIRTSEKRTMRSTQVIVVTAHFYAGQKDKVFLAGGNDHIAKPFRPEILYKKIKKLQKARRSLDKNGIDFRNLDEAVSSSEAVKVEIIKTFIQQTSQALMSMKSAYKKADFDKICKIAHKVKPSAYYISIPGFLSYLKKIEDSCGRPVDEKKLKELIYSADGLFKASLGVLSIELYKHDMTRS